MTDLEMTRLGAEAMDIDLHFPASLGGRKEDYLLPHMDQNGRFLGGYWWGEDGVYDPLHDDAQAMALVKKFKLLVNNGVGHSSTDLWHVQTQDDRDESVECNDLNRAIVECVAKMQAAKK